MRNIQNQIHKALIIALALVLITATTHAQNIDLATVPDRDGVQLTIYNAEDITLVRETRTLTFKQGINPLQFSWTNTLIDPTSVQIEFKTHADKLTVLDTTFPHDRKQMLYWNIASEHDGPATVEITYFTSGITWRANYTGIVTPRNNNANESAMALTGYVTITNNSGEAYEDAQVRLVVGEINLVDEIKRLAEQGIVDFDFDKFEAEGGDFFDAPEVQAIRRQSMSRMLSVAEDSMAQAPKEIVKEGLSEYFIFTIEGTETIPQGWSKRLKAIHSDEADLRVQYRYRRNQYGPQLTRMFLLKNNEASDLGQAPLPDGQVYLYQNNGKDGQNGLAFLAHQSIPYIPIGEDIEINLGPDRNVIFETTSQFHFRDNFILQLGGADVLQELGKPGIRIDPRSEVVGWTQNQVYADHISNHTSRPIELVIRHQFGGDSTFTSQRPVKSHDVNTIEYTTTLNPNATQNVNYMISTNVGRSAKQNRLAIKQAPTPTPPWQK